MALGLCTVSISPALAQADFAQMAAKEPGAQVTSSGLVYRSLQEGQGANPVGNPVSLVRIGLREPVSRSVSDELRDDRIGRILEYQNFNARNDVRASRIVRDTRKT